MPYAPTKMEATGIHYNTMDVSLRPSLKESSHLRTQLQIFFLFCIEGGGGGIQGPLGTAATNGLLCPPRVIMIMEKLVE
jgi:hypothetical protein